MATKPSRKYHCKLCPYTNATLWGLRAHHVKRHGLDLRAVAHKGAQARSEAYADKRAAGHFSTLPSRKAKYVTNGALTHLPTVPTSQPASSRGLGGPSLGGLGKMAFCPNCGEPLAAWRRR